MKWLKKDLAEPNETDSINAAKNLAYIRSYTKDKKYDGSILSYASEAKASRIFYIQYLSFLDPDLFDKAMELKQGKQNR
jgi:hypothetical protein